MPNRAAIRDWVRTQTLLETDDLADDKINRMINQALRSISVLADWPWLLASTTFSTSASSYAIPTDFGRVLAVYVDGDPNRMREMSLSEMYENWGGDLPKGEPQAFAIDGPRFTKEGWPAIGQDVTGDIIFVPDPDGTSYDFTLHYYRAVEALVMDDDADFPPFGEEFHMVLANFAIARVWEREEDFTKAQQSQADYDRGVEDMARRYLRTAEEHPTIIGHRAYQRVSASNMPWLDGA